MIELGLVIARTSFDVAETLAVSLVARRPCKEIDRDAKPTWLDI